MTTETIAYTEPAPQLRHRQLATGDARVAVFTRIYATTVEDLWDACTDPARLARWYTTVAGDLRLGGRFTQTNMGGGTISRCDPPHRLTLTLGDGADEIDVTIASGPREGTAELEIQHATTLDTHTIGGEVYDAVYCMGGGYYPRLAALDQLLRGTLPADYDATAFHLNPDMRETIERGSTAMADLLEQAGGDG